EQFAGRVRTGRREIIARTTGEYRDLDEVRSIVIAREGQAKLYLRDVAEVVDSHEEVRIITRLDGKPCVKLSALKQADANTVEVAKAVSRKLADLEPVLPPGLRVGIVENQATYVETALAGVRNAAIQAAVLLIIVVYLFLGSFRQVLVMIIAMPLTLVLNFGLMKLAGFSLNIFSLGGLVISIGVVLDNSIVVLESITRGRHERPEDSPSAQAVDGTTQVGPAVVAATLSFLALFIPFLLVPGLTTLLFRELILVMAGIVVISLTVAVTLTPMLTAALFGRSHRGREEKRFERFFRRVTDGYGRLLGWVLRGRWIAALAFLGVLLLAFWVMGRLGSEFLPPVDDGRIMIKVRLPTGAAVTKTDRVLRQIEQRLGEDELIESRFTLVGGLVRGLYTYEIANEGEIDIQLVPRAERGVSTDEYVNRLRPLATQVAVPGGKVMVMQRRIRGIRGLGQADIEVKIRGQDIATLFALARSAAGAMNELEHFKNVYVSMDLSKPEYRVQVDRVKAAELEVSVSDVAQALRSLITGAVATRYRDSDEYYNVRVMVPEEQITSREDVENLPLTCAQGEPLRVRDVA
ncbi:MAG: efflux RND transporter permease subunit, partial [Candidatus Brocadiae bacterium]|nr:efflux RND transporter permease subunit [Candidatus Brocadiia bacterium]